MNPNSLKLIVLKLLELRRHCEECPADSGTMMTKQPSFNKHLKSSAKAN